MSFVQQIPNLPLATSLSGAEQMEIVQAGVSMRATLQQVIDLSTQDDTGLFVLKAGDTMTGPLVINGGDADGLTINVPITANRSAIKVNAPGWAGVDLDGGNAGASFTFWAKGILQWDIAQTGPGTPWAVDRFNPVTGDYVDQPLQIDQLTGEMTLSHMLTVTPWIQVNPVDSSGWSGAQFNSGGGVQIYSANFAGNTRWVLNLIDPDNFSDFSITRADNAGNNIDKPFIISRATGLVTINDGLTVNGAGSFTTIPIAPTAATADNSTKLATTAFVKAQGYQVAASLGTMAVQNANSVAITGGAINGTTVGATTPSTGAFTTLSASGVVSGAGFTTLLNPYALVNSQVFTGTPSLPTGTIGVTQAALNNSTKLATTAYVDGAITVLGLGTMAAQNANAVAITGGAINNTAIGATTRSSGAFTTLAANGAATFTSSLTASPASANVTLSPTGTGTVIINPATVGSIDNTAVGATTPNTGKFTTLSATSINSTPIGPTTPSTGAFTTLSANGAATFTGSLTASPASANVTFSPTGTGTVTINPATLGHIDNTAVGATTPSTGAFTNLSATGTVSGAGFTTLLNPYALVNSQVFTGTPSLPTGTIGVTQATATNNTTLATTAFVKAQAYLTANQSIALTGDVTGSGATSIASTVVQLQGRPLAATAPVSGNLMGWNGSTWGPVAAGAVSAGGTNGQIQYNNGGVLGGLTLNGTGNPVGTTSPTFAGSVVINGTALGSVAGNSQIIFSPGSTDTNGEALRTEIQRKSAGSDWSTAAWQIYRQVDATKMGYLEFGNGSSKPIAFGNGVTEFMSLDNTGYLNVLKGVGAGGNITSSVANAALIVSKTASGQNASVYGQINALNRWQMSLADVAAESSGNAGSNFSINRFNDAGTYIDTPFAINRASGISIFSQAVAAASYTVNALAATDAALYLNKPASGRASTVYGQMAGSTRWGMNFGDSTAEATGSVGSNFGLARFDNTGAFIDTPFQMIRSTGQAYFTQALNAQAGIIINYANPVILIGKTASGQSNSIYGQTANVTRWQQQLGDGTAEGGSNLGSNYVLSTYSDAGAAVGNPLVIERSSGYIRLNGNGATPTAASTAPFGHSQIVLNKAGSTKTCNIVGQNNGSARWEIDIGNTIAESGSNAGSDFAIARFSDTGAGIDYPLSILRSSGTVTISGSAVIGSNATVSGNLTSGSLATTGGQVTIFQQSGNSFLNVCDSAGNNGGSYNMCVRGLGSAFAAQVNMNVFTIAAASTVCNGNLSLTAVNTRVDSLGGFLCRFGLNGSALGNVFSIAYNSGPTYIYIDTTNMGAVTFTSDYRIKQNIAPLPSMWDRAKTLNPIRYEHKDWTPEWATPKENGDAPDPMFVADGKERWGFVAHELQETLIEDAATGVKDEQNLIQSPNPWTVIAVLTKALQEAMARIEALEARA
jgi:hypothetical protein